MWERRYEFSKPMRDEKGERRYSAPEVTKLRAIKRLMDTGITPGKIVLRTIEDLNLLDGRMHELPDLPTVPAIVSETFSLLQRHDAPGLRSVLVELLVAREALSWRRIGSVVRRLRGRRGRMGARFPRRACCHREPKLHRNA